MTGRCKAVGRKGKEVKEVPGTAEPRIVPMKRSQTGEGKQFDVEHLISQVILLPFQLNHCSQIPSSELAVLPVQI